MENQTKRMRKARRQGLARKKEFSEPNPKLQVRAGHKPADDTPQDAPAQHRRKSTLTQRKTQRGAGSTTRRATGRRVRK